MAASSENRFDSSSSESDVVLQDELARPVFVNPSDGVIGVEHKASKDSETSNVVRLDQQRRSLELSDADGAWRSAHLEGAGGAPRRGVSLDLRRSDQRGPGFIRASFDFARRRARMSLDVRSPSSALDGAKAPVEGDGKGEIDGVEFVHRTRSRSEGVRLVFQSAFDEMSVFLDEAYFDFRFKNGARWDAYEICRRVLRSMHDARHLTLEASSEALASLERENRSRHFLYLSSGIAVPVLEVLCLQKRAQLGVIRLRQVVNLGARDRQSTKFVIVLLTPNAVFSSSVKKWITFLVHAFTSSHERDESVDLRQLLWASPANRITSAAISDGLKRFREKELEKIQKNDREVQEYGQDVAGGGNMSVPSVFRPSVDWARHRISAVLGKGPALGESSAELGVQPPIMEASPNLGAVDRVERKKRDVRVTFRGESPQESDSGSTSSDFVPLPEDVRAVVAPASSGASAAFDEEIVDRRGGSIDGGQLEGSGGEQAIMSVRDRERESQFVRRSRDRRRGSGDDERSGRRKISFDGRRARKSMEFQRIRDLDSQPTEAPVSGGGTESDDGDSGTRSSWSDSDSAGYSSDSDVSFFDSYGGALHFQAEEHERKVERSRRSEQVIPQGLNWIKWPFGGLWDDFKRRFPYYPSDWKAGLSVKCAAAIAFLFFSSLTPAVAFGSLLGLETKQAIGVMEMVIATGFVGVIFAMFGGQPLIIQAGTGPLLVFTKYLFQITEMLGIEFLPAYAWIGLWTGSILVFVSIFDLNFLIRFLSPFTDEIFAALISLIFIYEAVYDLLHQFVVAEKDNYEVPLLGVILGLGVYYIAIVLKDFRHGRFLRPRLRSLLSDFGSPIAILCMTVCSVVMPHVEVEKLNVPSSLQTTSGRPWLIHVTNVPVWWPFAAILPAFLAAILCYLDENITARIVNRPQNRLKKGPAYDLDLLVVGLCIIICSMMGLPWLVAATVQSMNHLQAVSVVEQRENEFGRVEPDIVRVYENRLTGTAIHLLVGLSVFASPVLRLIPLSALFGLFIFMGVSSLQGNLLWERLKLLATQPALFPPSHYARNVRFAKIVLFTLIQLTCLVVLWIVKTSPIAITFPLFIVALVPVRLLIGKLPFFTKNDLMYLDSDELPEHEHEE